MNIFLIIATASIISSCANFEEHLKYLSGDTQREKERVDKEKKEEESKINDEIARKISLPNTINLKIGQTKDEVKDILFSPEIVSADQFGENWHYRLYENYSRHSILNKIVPYKIKFKNEKVISYGVDQEQVERNKAQVVIQKDMTEEKKN